MNSSSENFVSGKGTRFIQEGAEVVICRGDAPLMRVPFSDLLDYAKALTGIKTHLWPNDTARIPSVTQGE